jgi:DNA gyrase/topoisomerase IV subunit B
VQHLAVFVGADLNFLLVAKSGVIESIIAVAQFKSDQQLKKTDGHKRSRLSGISKLDDANNAGTRNGSNCTLILTEGDSAKSLVVAGLGTVGRDNFGVFPLRGWLGAPEQCKAKRAMNLLFLLRKTFECP